VSRQNKFLAGFYDFLAKFDVRFAHKQKLRQFRRRDLGDQDRGNELARFSCAYIADPSHYAAHGGAATTER
jgi:hypothetical protein